MSRCCEINFTLEQTNLQFNIKNSTLPFNIDLGYVGGNLSYYPLSEKPQVNFKILQSGNNTCEYLGIQEKISNISDQEIDTVIYGG